MTRIGEGETSEVFRIEPGIVVKLFRADYCDQDDVHREFAVARHVGANTAVAPAAFELTEIDGRVGYTMEEITGPLFQDVIDSHPDRLLDNARLLGRAHRAIHELPYDPALSSVPSMKEAFPDFVGSWGCFPAEVREWLVSLISGLPDDRHLLHGDFMPYNMIMHDGEAFAVDWAGTLWGPALADVARTVNFIVDPTEYPDSPYTLRAEEFVTEYLRAYSGLASDTGDGTPAPVAAIDWDLLHRCLIFNAAAEVQWAERSGQVDSYTDRSRRFVLANHAEYGSDRLTGGGYE